MTSCKYCSIPLDVQTVSSSIGNQDKANNAYNAASNIRILAGTMVTLFFLAFIPFIGFIFSIIHYIAFLGVPFLLLFWLIRYRSLKTTDPGYKDAKKYCWTALFIWLGFQPNFYRCSNTIYPDIASSNTHYKVDLLRN
jgi:hypothetical protein